MGWLGNDKGVLTKLVDKQQKREFKTARAEEKRRKKEDERKGRLEKLKQETAYYKTKTARNKAKRSASPIPTVNISIGKKKQGKKLSRRGKVRLI